MRHYPLKFVVMLALMLMAGCQAAGQTAVAEATVEPTPTADERAISRAEVLGTIHALESLTPTPSPPLSGIVPTVTPEPVADMVWYQSDTLIVYTRDQRLCALSSEQSPVFLADATWLRDFGPFFSGVQVSDDGEVIAFVRRLWSLRRSRLEFDQLWAVNADGTSPRLLLDLEELYGDRPGAEAPGIWQWELIPGTHQIILTNQEFPVLGGHIFNDLILVDANSGQTATLLTEGSGGSEFAISPDGRQIAYFAEGRREEDGTQHPDIIGLVNTGGSEWRPNVFTYEVIFTYSEFHLFANPTWRPDSHGLWVVVPPHDPEFSGDTTMTAWYIPDDGSPPVPIMTWDPVEIIRRDFGVPVVSPNGQHVAFNGTMGDTGSGLHILSIDGEQDILYYDDVSETTYTTFKNWESDSVHFAFWVVSRNSSVLYRGGIGEDYTPVPEPEVPPQGCAP